MSQLGRISGQLLKDNLTRQGTDLALDTDLLYLNVNSRYVSINTDITSKPLFVNGEFYSTNFNTTSIDGITSFNLDFVANSIISQNNLNLVASTYVFADNIRTDNISIDNNSIVTLQSNSNLELRPNGVGTVEIQSNTNITGNLTATGSITLDGNIIFGDSDTDNVTFLADINTDIIPDQNEFYNLGTNLKRWNTVYPELVNGEEITSLEMLSGGVNLALRQGNIWYVAANGSNSNVGDHQSGPFATIAKALSEATAGDTVFIYPGTYTEITPLTVPAGVSVRGFDLRSVNIIPDSTTTSENIFLLNGETTVSDLTIKNFYYDSVNDTGYAFSFAPGMTVTSRSPYVQNITVLTQGTTITVDDPRGFASGDAGRGAKVDGSLATAVSKEASMLFHSVTFITPGVDALVMTNGVRVEWLNSFTYFANRGLYATQGTLGLASLDVRFGAEIRSIGSANVYGNYGAEADGASTLMYLIQHNFAYIGAGKDVTNDPSLNISANETIELGGGKIYYQSLDNKGNFKVGDAFGVSFETGRVTISGIGVGAGGVTSITLANGTDETVIDATEVLVNNIRFSGNTLSSIYGDVNLDSATNELNTTNNVTAINDIDITGDFTVDGMLTIGNAFIDVVEFVAPVDYGLRAIIDNTHSLGNSTKRWDDVIVFDSYIGNLKVSDNVITTLDSNADLELRADGTGRIYVPVDNVEFDQNLTINGTSYTKNISLIGSLLQAGNIQRTGDTTTGNYTQIGNQTFNGNGLYDDVLVTGNSITSSSSNANLVLDAAGTGRIYIPFSDVQVINDFVVEGLLDGSIASVTTSTTAQTYSNNNISIGTNIIQTTVSNSDLELRAAGTGRIYVPVDNVEFDQNLTVNDTANLDNTNITGLLDYTGNITRTGTTTQIGNQIITGDLTVSSNVDFGDIEFINNRLITTRSNSDLEFKTAGSGVVKFISPTRFEQAATFNNVFTSNITNSNTVTSNIFYNGNIEFYDNNLRTTNSNSDLVLLANNTGTISMPLDPLVLGQDFTVTLSSTLKNTTINGLLQHVGATVQTGNNTQTGNFVLTGDLTVGNDAYFENVNFINNQITTVNSNSNLELRAAGAGAVIINDNLILGQGLTVTGLSSTVTISNSALITSEKFVNNDILIQDNYITTTQSNSNLVLSGELTGGPRLERIKFDNNTISTTTGNENVVIQGTTNNIIFNTISAVKIPTGTNAQRPTLAQADLRFNTTETLFNGYSGAKVTFGGVYSADQRTNLTAHPTNNTLNFVANLIPSATISSTGINLNGLSTDNNLLFNGNTISSQSLNSDIFFTTNGTGQVKIDDLGVRSNQFNNLNTTQPLILQNTGFGYIQFAGTGGLVIPAGDISQRPLNPETGDIRWNNEDEQAEVFNGTQYQSFQGDSGTTLTGEEVEDVTNLWALILG